MSDSEYDALVERLQATRRPPADQARGESVTLPVNMPSLDKTGPSDVASRISDDTPYCVSDKLDGVSCLYDGPTDRLLTRGDGVTGRDVSRIRHTGLGVPSGLPSAVVRGELVIDRSTFAHRFAATAANARNLVAGVVNAVSPDPKTLAVVRFVAYELIEPSGRSPAAQFAEMSAMGFEVACHWLVPDGSVLDGARLTGRLALSKARSAYDVDGLVVAEDLRYVRAERGNPKNVWAYKDAALQDAADVAVTGVTWTASRHARLVPVVLFDPIRLAGANVSRATGHNYGFIQAHGIGEGAVVRVVRSGDVIPKIESVRRWAVASASPPGAFTVQGVHAVSSDMTLEAHAATRLAHFFGELSVRGAGPAVAARLVDAGYSLPADVMALTSDAATEAVGSVAAAGVPAALSAAVSQAPLWKLLSASGAFGPGVGKTALRSIQAAHPSGLTDVTVESAAAVPGVGLVTARKFVDGLAAAYAYVDGLVAASAVTSVAVESSPLVDQVVCFSGVRSADAELRLFAVGADITTSGAAATMLVVRRLPPPDTAKTRAATARGAEVVTLEELDRRLGP